jgi:hypothetical protein
MSAYQKDERREYTVLQEYVAIGSGWCCRCDVRQYANGETKVVSGAVKYRYEMTNDVQGMWQVYAIAKAALESNLEAPK